MSYLNFRSETNEPVNKYMSGKYQVGDMKLENFSIPVDILSIGKDTAVVKTLQDVDLPWIGKYNDKHAEQYLSISSIVVPLSTISDNPEFPIPEFIKADEYSLSPKRATAIVETLIDTIILENKETDKRIEECKKYGFTDNEITDLQIVTEAQMQSYLDNTLQEWLDRE